MQLAKPQNPGGTAGTSEELFALADAISAATGGAVSIEDLDYRVLAYSTLPDQRIDEHRRRGILQRRVPPAHGQPRQYRELLSAEGVLRFPVLAEDELPRVAVAVRAGALPLGSIWAIEDAEEPIDAAGEQALREGARLAALHMLRRRSAVELELRAREDALRAALRAPRTAREARYELGLTAPRPLVLLGHAPCLAGAGDRAPYQLGEAAARHWAAVHAEASVAVIGRTVYVLLPMDRDFGPDEASKAARRMGVQATSLLERRLGAPLRTAAGRVGHGPEDLPALRAEVDEILRVTTADPVGPAFADLGDTHARVLLGHVTDELNRRPTLRHPGIEAMLAHDRERGTAFAESVTAWLDAVGNVADAARRLGVHPNTLKYRLRRVRDLFALDLDHPDNRLSCWLQLRARRA